MLARHTQQERAIAEKTCPKCGQLPGRPCRRASTRAWTPYVLTNPHKERIDLIRAEKASRVEEAPAISASWQIPAGTYLVQHAPGGWKVTAGDSRWWFHPDATAALAAAIRQSGGKITQQ